MANRPKQPRKPDPEKIRCQWCNKQMPWGDYLGHLTGCKEKWQLKRLEIDKRVDVQRIRLEKPKKEDV